MNSLIFVDRLQSNNCKIKFSGVQEEVMAQFKRNHFDEYVGKDSFCWDAIMALEALDKELLINELTKIKKSINIKHAN